MVPGLQEINPVFPDKINEAMLLGQSSRPCARGQIFERYGFADSVEGVAQNRRDAIENPQRQLAVGFHLIKQVFDDLGLEYRREFFLTQDRPRGAKHPH